MRHRKLLRVKLPIARNLKQSSFSKSQRTSLGAATSKEELVQINEEKETPETHSESKSKCYLSLSLSVGPVGSHTDT